MTSPLLDGMIDLSLAAGRVAMEIYAGEIETEVKDDASPVTRADKEGEAIILAGLAALAPDIPILAEEAASEGRIPELGRRFFLVDPLDGTKEFIKKTGEFTVNIALVEDNRPIMGVVYAPAIKRLFFGSKEGGAFSQTIAAEDDRAAAEAPQPITVRSRPKTGLCVVASRSHRSPETDAYLEGFDVAEFKAAGSSLKFCLIAAGEADLYPRLGRTMEWDTGAGQAVLEAAGGGVTVFEGEDPLLYGKKARGFDNPFFVAFGGK